VNALVGFLSRCSVSDKHRTGSSVSLWYVFSYDAGNVRGRQLLLRKSGHIVVVNLTVIRIVIFIPWPCLRWVGNLFASSISG
jgi:hypothetical protein